MIGISTSDILEAGDTSDAELSCAEKRMLAVWKKMNKVPFEVVFAKSKKFTGQGMRWAPKSFLLMSHEDLRMSTLFLEPPQEPHQDASRSDDGLLACLWGMVFELGDWAFDKETFFLYNMEFDKIFEVAFWANAELPGGSVVRQGAEHFDNSAYFEYPDVTLRPSDTVDATHMAVIVMNQHQDGDVASEEFSWAESLNEDPDNWKRRQGRQARLAFVRTSQSMDPIYTTIYSMAHVDVLSDSDRANRDLRASLQKQFQRSNVATRRDGGVIAVKAQDMRVRQWCLG